MHPPGALEHLRVEVAEDEDVFVFTPSATGSATTGSYASAVWIAAGINVNVTLLFAQDVYEQAVEASHVFNLLQARGVISVQERASYKGRVRRWL